MIISVDHSGNSGCRIGLASACYQTGTGQFIRNLPQGAPAAIDFVPLRLPGESDHRWID
jgi:hypothetical protein